MSGLSRMDRERFDRFNRYWIRLYQVVPEARAEAVAAMGEEVQKDLEGNIQSADLGAEAKEHVRSWQSRVLGSKGGYAAVKPAKGTVMSWYQMRSGGTKVRQNTYRGKAVTAKQVTRWLERGHGVRGSGGSYVAGRQFYSDTKQNAVEHALKAADKVLCRIADEVDY